MNKLLYFSIALFALCACSSSGEPNGSMLRSMVYSSAQMDEANLAEYYRGSISISDLRSELKTTPHILENKDKLDKLGQLIEQFESVDKEAGRFIQQIEELKIALLKEASINSQQEKNQDPKAIIWRLYNTDNSCLPSKLNLAALTADQMSYSVADILVSDDPATLTDFGKKLWEGLQNFRLNVVRITAHNPFSPKKQSLKFSAINQFKNPESLRQQVGKMIENSGANTWEDGELLTDLYCKLTKPEFIQEAGQKTHWINRQFEGANLVSAILTLNSLENEVLQARSLALMHIDSKDSYCGPGFDDLKVLTDGPTIAMEGEEIALNISFGAIQKWPQQSISVDGIKSTIEYKNGINTLRFKPQKGVQTIKGTISFRNNSGMKVIRPWEWKVTVIEKLR